MFERRAKKAQNMLFRYITTTAGAGSTFAETLELVVSLDSFYFKNNGSFLMDGLCSMCSMVDATVGLFHKQKIEAVLHIKCNICLFCIFFLEDSAFFQFTLK